MNLTKSRLLSLTSSLKSTYALVSLPEKAWALLEKMATDKYPRAGFQGLVDASRTDCPKELTIGLRRKAQESYENQMGDLYALANDNRPKEGYGDLKRNPSLPEAPEFILEMPSVIRLFHFMPHATYLTTVFERRNMSYLPRA